MEKGRGDSERDDICMLVVDVRKAHLCAPASRDVFIDLPKEDRAAGEEDMCGHLKFSMYGTRGAAKNWSLEVERTVKELGFEVGVFSPCLFHSKEKQIGALCHGDDIVAVGSRSRSSQSVVVVGHRR